MWLALVHLYYFEIASETLVHSWSKTCVHLAHLDMLTPKLKILTRKDSKVRLINKIPAYIWESYFFMNNLQTSSPHQLHCQLNRTPVVLRNLQALLWGSLVGPRRERVLARTTWLQLSSVSVSLFCSLLSRLFIFWASSEGKKKKVRSLRIFLLFLP